MVNAQDNGPVKVGDNSLIIHKSAYHLFSVLISKRGFSSLQTRKTFGKIVSGNYLMPVIRVTRADKKKRAAHSENFLGGLVCTGNLAFRLQ